MKIKQFLARLGGRISRKRMLAAALALACAVTCIIGAVIGATFASGAKPLQGKSFAAVSFGGGTVQAYLEENTLSGTEETVPDTLNLTLEAVRPTIGTPPGGGDGTCECASAVFCGDGTCEFACSVCKAAVFCGDGACEFDCATCKDAVFCGDGVCGFVCSVCKDAVFCGDGVCEFTCSICQDAVSCDDETCPGDCGVCAEAVFCGEGACLGCGVCEDAVFCGEGACLGCTVCEDAVFCGEGACLGCTVCEGAVFCGEGACTGCTVCKDALCSCVDCGCIDCGCEYCSGSGGPDIVMDDLLLHAELAGHVLDNFTLTGITVSVNGTDYDIDDPALDAIVYVTAGGGVFSFRLFDAFEEGGSFKVTFQLAFNRGGYDPTQTAPGVLTDLLAASFASYNDEDSASQSQNIASPQIIYPAATEGLLAEVNTAILRGGVDIPGKYVKAGDTVRYHLKIENDTGEEITNLPVEFHLPAGVAFDDWVRDDTLQEPVPDLGILSWIIPALAADGIVEMVFDVTVGTLESGVTHRSLPAHAVVAGGRVDGDTLEQWAGGLACEITASPPDGSAVQAGDRITYTFTVQNVGEEDAENIEAVIELLTGDVTEVTSECTSLGGNLSGTIGGWVISKLEPGDQVILVYVVEVGALEGGKTSQEYHAAAAVRSVTEFTPEEYASEDFRHTQYAEGDLQAALSALPGGGASVYAGQRIEYAIELTNSGGSALTDIPVSCAIPAGTSLVADSVDPDPEETPTAATVLLEWVIQSLAPGETVTLTFTVEAQELPGGTARDIECTALVDGAATNTVAHTQSPMDLEFEKSGDLTDYVVTEDDVVTYAIDVTNKGGSPAYNVEIADTLPAGLDYVIDSATGANGPVDFAPGRTITCDITGNGIVEGVNSYSFRWTINQLPPGGSVTVGFQARVTALPEGSAGRDFDNTAYVGGEATNTVSYRQLGGPLDAGKTADPPGGEIVRADDTILYTLWALNVVYEPQYDVVLIDEIPEEVDFDASYVPSVAVNGTDLAYVDQIPLDPSEKEGKFTYSVSGGTIQFVVGAVPVDSIAEASFQVKILAPAAESSQSTRDIVNIADVRAAEAAGLQTNEVTHIQALTDLAAVKTALPASGETVYTRKADGSGTRITYFVEITNTGAESKENVEIEDAIPAGLTYVPGSMTAENTTEALGGTQVQGQVNAAGTELRWLVESIAAGESITVEFKADVTPLSAGQREFVNTALVDGKATNAVSHSQYASSLRAEKSADPAGGFVEADDIITYTIEVENTGSGGEINLPVSDSIPAGTEYVPGSATDTAGIACSETIQDSAVTRLDWVIAALAPGGKAIIEFQVRVLPLPDGEGLRGISNSAQAGEDGAAVMSNAVEHQQGTLDLTAGKSADKTRIAQGEAVVYTISVTNNSAIAAADIPVSDTIPEGMSYVPGSADSTDGTYDADAKTVDWTIASIAPGATATVTFQATADDLPAGVLSLTVGNTAAVNGADTNTAEVVVYSHLLEADPPGGSTVAAGDVIEYTISLFNAGTEEFPVRVENELPAGTRLVEGSITGLGDGTYIPATNTIVWEIDALPAGLTQLTFQVEVLDGAEDEIRNKALVYGFGGGDTAEETNEVVHPVEDTDPGAARIEAEKYAASSAPVSLGDTIQYFIALENTGTLPAPLTQVYDEIPAGTSLVPGSILGGGAPNSALNRVEWDVEDLAPGETVTLGFTVEVITAQAGEIVNTAMAGGEATNTVTHEVLSPALYAEKSADKPGTADLRPGDTLTYTITVYNNTDADMTGIPVLDVIPAGTSYVNGSANQGGMYTEAGNKLEWLIDIAAQSSEELTFQVTVNDIGSGEVTITNRALYGEAEATIPDIFTNAVTHTARANITGLEAEKSAVPGIDHIFAPGETITYTIEVTNTGNVTLLNVKIEDAIPDGTAYSGALTPVDGKLSWDIASIAPGDTETRTFAVTVEAEEGIIANKAEIIHSGQTTQTNEVLRYVGGAPEVRVTKGSNPPEGQVTGGQTLTYTLYAANTGTAEASNIKVWDTLPAGVSFAGFVESPDGTYDAAARKISWEIPSLAPNEVKTLVFAVTVNVNTGTAQVSVKNKAFYIPGAGFEELETNELTHVVPPAAASIAVSKSADKASLVKTGDIITYSITVRNGGAAPVAAITVTDAIPAGLAYVAGSASDGGALSGGTLTWAIASLAAGAEKTVTFQVTVQPPAQGQTGARTFTNVAHAGGAQSNAVIHTALPKLDEPHVSAIKSASPGPGDVQPGSEITYTIALANDGNCDLTGVTMTDLIPEGTTLVAGSISNGGAAAAGTITWTADLAEDEIKEFSFRVTVNALAEDAQSRQIRNTAHVKGPNELDTNEVVHTVKPVIAPPPPDDLELTKTNNKGENGNVIPGDTITYALTVTNKGTAAARDIAVSDAIPSGVTYVEGSASDGGTLKDGVLTWTIVELAAGAPKAVSFKVTVNALPAGTAMAVIENKGYVNNVLGGSTKNTVTRQPVKVSAVKRTGPLSSFVAAGSAFTYYIDVTNHSDLTVAGVMLTDSVPAGVTLAQGSIEGGGTVSGGLITWSLDLGPKQTKTVSFRVVADPLPAGQRLSVIRNTAKLGETPTNEVLVFVVSQSGGGINIGNGNDVNIGNGSGNGNNNGNHSNNGNNGNNNGNNNGSGSNGTNGSNGKDGTNGSNGSNIGGKDIPKTSEASALWAILLVLGSGAVIAASAALLLRRKRLLQR